MKKSRKTIVLLAMLMTVVLLGGCTQPVDQPIEEQPPVEEEPVEQEPVEELPEAQEEAPEALPESVETTILIEGMEEPMTMLLYQNELMPFYTYHPEDMLAEEWIYDHEKGVRFYANFGGTMNKSAYVEIKVYPVDALGDEEAFLQLVTGADGILANRGVEWVEKEDPVDRIFSWSIMEYFYLNDEFTGALYLGRQGDDYFYVDVHYPWEFGDGMEGRANVIMKEFKWNDGPGLLN